MPRWTRTPSRSASHDPGGDRTLIFWVLHLHHRVAAVLLVEDLLALCGVKAHRDCNSVMETNQSQLEAKRSAPTTKHTHIHIYTPPPPPLHLDQDQLCEGSRPTVTASPPVSPHVWLSAPFSLPLHHPCCGPRAPASACSMESPRPSLLLVIHVVAYRHRTALRDPARARHVAPTQLP